MKLIGVTFFALFWNGIISVFVWQATKGWRSGHKDWCLTTFMIPFVLVGLGAIVMMFYTLLTLANSRVRVTISKDRLHLGDSAELSWEFDGRYDRISHLKITLEGREEARYRRGTRTYTDRQTFAEIPIVDTSKDLDIRRGKKPFTIPADLMHSWESGNNKIVWQVKVHGEISRWPDVNEEMTVKVEPGVKSE